MNCDLDGGAQLDLDLQWLKVPPLCGKGLSRWGELQCVLEVGI